MPYIVDITTHTATPDREAAGSSVAPYPNPGKRVPCPVTGILRNFIASASVNTSTAPNIVDLLVNGTTISQITIDPGDTNTHLAQGNWPIAQGDTVSFRVRYGGGAAGAFLVSAASLFVLPGTP